MNITGVTRTIYPPYGGIPLGPLPAAVRRSFHDADAGTLVDFTPGLAPVGTPPQSGPAPVDPDAGTLIILR